MRLLVDEDLGSRELLRRLDEALPGRILAPEREMSDEAVWTRAQGHGAAILTANVVDFLSLAAERPDHNGLLLVYRVNSGSRRQPGDDDREMGRGMREGRGESKDAMIQPAIIRDVRVHVEPDGLIVEWPELDEHIGVWTLLGVPEEEVMMAAGLKVLGAAAKA